MLEIRIPIAPTESFFSNVRLAALSLRALGEPYASARMVVSTGGDRSIDEIVAATGWSHSLPIDWFVVPPAIWARGGHEAGAAADRFPSWTKAGIVIHCDADVCLVDRIDDLLDRLNTESPILAGVMAHQSPFARDPAENDAAWREVLDACGLPDVALDQSYALADPSVCGRCPVYYNAGFLAMNRTAWLQLSSVVQDSVDLVHAILRRTYDPAYAVQVGLSVALLKSTVEPLVLGLEYNCPNTDDVFARRAGLAESLKVLHYQRRDEFDRHSFLVSDDALAHFYGAAFEKRMNRIFQRHVRQVLGASKLGV